MKCTVERLIFMLVGTINADGLVNKFPDDTKIVAAADSEVGCQSIQWGIDQLRWQMEFNLNKSEVERLNVWGNILLMARFLSSLMSIAP